ncbi:MAG TPA: hypothetical protein VER32_10935 [Pyrinomonadaceae bacterium]|nr:hypothetical protein [Pyrinomonadaceae bacterium]
MTTIAPTLVPLEVQTLLAPLGVRFRDAVTGAPVSEGLVVSAYPTGATHLRTFARQNRSGTHVVHAGPGLHEFTRGAGDDDFWAGVTQKKSFTVEVADALGRYLPATFPAELPNRGLFTWTWPLEATSATNTTRPSASLRDDFADTTRDATKWRLGTLATPDSAHDESVTAVEQSGQLVVTPRSGEGGRHYNGYLSAATWGATNARLSVEVVEVTQGAAETIFTAAHDEDNRVRFVAQAGQLLLQSRVAAQDTAESVVYDAAAQRFWSLRHDPVADEIVFETSADGRAWVRRRAVARGFPLTALTIELGAGTGSSVATPGVARFDNFLLESNPTEAVPLYSAPTRAAAGGMAVLRAELWNPLPNGGKGAPAAHALVEATVAGQRTLRGLSDKDGRLAIHFPYPEPTGAPDGQGGTLPPPAYTSQEWGVTLRAFYAPPQGATPPLPDLAAVLEQPAASLWSDEARNLPLPAQTLRFGRELIVRTQRTTSAPLDATTLPVLLITPAP